MQTVAESNLKFSHGHRSTKDRNICVDLQSCVLSHEAQLKLDALSASLVDDRLVDSNRLVDSKRSIPGSIDSRSSANSNKSRNSNTARPKKTKKRSEKQGSSLSAKKTSKAAPSALPVGSVVIFPPIPNSNEVWNRIFAGRRPEAAASQVEQDLASKMQQLRHLNKMERMRQRRSNPNTNEPDAGAGHLGNRHVLPESSTQGSSGLVEQQLNVASRKAKGGPQDCSVHTLQSVASSEAKFRPQDCSVHNLQSDVSTSFGTDSQSSDSQRSSKFVDNVHALRSDTHNSSGTDRSTESWSCESRHNTKLVDVVHALQSDVTKSAGTENWSCKSPRNGKLVNSSRNESKPADSVRRKVSSGKQSEVPHPSQQEMAAVQEGGECCAGVFKLIESAFAFKFGGGLCLPRKSVDKSPSADTSSRDGHPRLQKCKLSKQAPPETASPQATVPITMVKTETVSGSGKRTSEIPGTSVKSSAANELEESVLSRNPGGISTLPKELAFQLPKELLTQIEAADFKDRSMPAMMKLLLQLSEKPDSPLVIPAILQLVTLCKRKNCVSTFERLGGQDILLIIANRADNCDSILVRFGVAAVLSLLITQRDGERFFCGIAENRKVVMLLLHCTVDLDTCSTMVRIAAPAFLTAIWRCLVAMILKGDMLAIQLQTKRTISRCLKLLEAAEDFKNSADLTASQVSAFLTAGFEFLAISAKNSKDICNLFIKEHVAYRTLTIISSCDVDHQKPEVAPVKELLSCLCSWSDTATNELLNWLSSNSDEHDATTIAIEVCMSALDGMRHSELGLQVHHRQRLSDENNHRNFKFK